MLLGGTFFRRELLFRVGLFPGGGGYFRNLVSPQYIVSRRTNGVYTEYRVIFKPGRTNFKMKHSQRRIINWIINNDNLKHNENKVENPLLYIITRTSDVLLLCGICFYCVWGET